MKIVLAPLPLSLALLPLAATGIAGGAVAQTRPAAIPTAPPHDDADGGHVLTRAQAAARADARFARLDTDHDGMLSGDERRAAMAMRDREADRPMTAAQFREHALARFDRADTDHDGRIDPAERQARRDAMRDRHHGARGDLPTPTPSVR